MKEMELRLKHSSAGPESLSYKHSETRSALIQPRFLVQSSSSAFDPCKSRGCSSMVERQLPKLHTRVRFPSPAPLFSSEKSLCKTSNQWFTECVPESSELREMPRSYAEFVRNCQENAVPLGARSSAGNFESLALNSETEVSCLSPRRPLC